MGCSSGSLTSEGDFDLQGTALNYLQAGCPSLLGNLWDVTDKDIDKLTLNVFEYWGLNGSERYTLPEAVSMSRNSCTLPYLNGAAVVVYGIPVILN